VGFRAKDLRIRDLGLGATSKMQQLLVSGTILQQLLVSGRQASYEAHNLRMIRKCSSCNLGRRGEREASDNRLRALRASERERGRHMLDRESLGLIT